MSRGLVDVDYLNDVPFYCAAAATVEWVAPEFSRWVRPAISRVPRWIAAAEAGLAYEQEGYLVRSSSDMRIEASMFEVVRCNGGRHLPAHAVSTATHEIAVELMWTRRSFREYVDLLGALSRRYDAVHVWVPTPGMATVIMRDAVTADFPRLITSVRILPAHAWLQPSHQAALRRARQSQWSHPGDPWSHGVNW